MTNKKIKDVLTKEPFKRIEAIAPLDSSAMLEPHYRDERPYWKSISQGQFLREYYPSGHKINDTMYYPDKIHRDVDEDGKTRYYEEKMIRCSFPLQKIISTKHIIHLCGNDIHFELTSNKETDQEKELFFNLKKGWHLKHSEQAFYHAVKGMKVTGDAAVAGVIHKGKFYWKVFSYLKGDTLFPHYDEIGQLKLFARKFQGYDEDGNVRTNFVEVWDKEYYQLFKQDTSGFTPTILGKLGLNGYRRAGAPVKHGFDFLPVTYHRTDDGACWSDVQDSIDKYELAVSHLSQNNLAYAFPILFLKGQELEIVGGEDIYRPTKSITGDKDSEASFLNTPNGSESFKLQLETLLDNIFQGSFTVLPPEIRSGDLPGVAIKLLYSPALERAMSDAEELDLFVADMVKIFAFGYGMEMGEMTKMRSLPINSWITPYIHQNTAELMNNLQQGVFGGFLSKETASEMTPYAKNDEFFRLLKETASEQQADTLTDMIP